jgi:nucleolar GTP-binding protein
MVVYNFKKIQPIPACQEFIDIVLTRTQRKTPTVIHPGFKIGRIRSFYMRKVKFTQQTIDEKLGMIVQDFPRLDDIHPFYGDLMNILYDRDHFKLALGQVNTAKSLVHNLCKDYLKLMKYGDSLYRCKQLKRAALGRMMTVLKKLKASLGYLEEIRKHISRLPALDPNTRTLLLTGYPNVGKSSFMNKVTRADVDVQPYAFTTKALFVGHMDHRMLRWQVVDTPGILDRPLEERNTIEMQAITALAHLQCCVLYFLDVSEQCGYPMEQQLALFESIRPLFAGKQVVMVANKCDVIPYDQLPAGTRARIEEVARTAGAELIPTSNISEENLSRLKTLACDKLLEARVESKLSSGRIKDDVMSRISVVVPKARDGTIREAFVPDSVLEEQRLSETGVGRERKATEKDLMLANGGAGVYACDYRKFYMMEGEEDWRFDDIPQFMDGKNVMDYFDEDIEQRLKALEDEEAQLEAQGAYALDSDDEDELNEEEMALFSAIKSKQGLMRAQSQVKKPQMAKVRARGRGEEEVREELEEAGHVADGVIEHMRDTRARKRTRVEPEKTRGRSMGAADMERGDSAGMEIDGDSSRTRRASRDSSRTRMASTTKSRPRSGTTGPKATLNPEQAKQVAKKERSLERHVWRNASRGEADRMHYPKLVKHMNSGKSSLGTSTIGR